MHLLCICTHTCTHVHHVCYTRRHNHRHGTCHTICTCTLYTVHIDNLLIDMLRKAKSGQNTTESNTGGTTCPKQAFLKKYWLLGCNLNAQHFLSRWHSYHLYVHIHVPHVLSVQGQYTICALFCLTVPNSLIGTYMYTCNCVFVESETQWCRRESWTVLLFTEPCKQGKHA